MRTIAEFRDAVTRIHPEIDWRDRYNEVKNMTTDERGKLANELGVPNETLLIVSAMNRRDFPELRH